MQCGKIASMQRSSVLRVLIGFARAWFLNSHECFCLIKLYEKDARFVCWIEKNLINDLSCDKGLSKKT